MFGKSQEAAVVVPVLRVPAGKELSARVETASLG